VLIGASVSTRAEISGIVINADGTIRETFGGPYSTWTRRFRVSVTGTVVGWVVRGVVAGAARELLHHYCH
jgi:hypothetical protein